MVLLLTSKKAHQTPIGVLHTAALLLNEAGEQMERGKFDFNFFRGRADLETNDAGYDTDELESQLE